MPLNKTIKREIEVVPKPVIVKLLHDVKASKTIPSPTPLVEPNMPSFFITATTGAVPDPIRNVCVLPIAVPVDFTVAPFSIVKEEIPANAFNVKVCPETTVTLVFDGAVPNVTGTHVLVADSYFSQTDLPPTPVVENVSVGAVV